MSLIGLLTAMEKQVSLGRLHMRPIQWHLKSHWKRKSPSQVLITHTFSGGPRKNCLTRSTPAPLVSCNSGLYRCLKRRLGCSLRPLHSKRILVSSRKSITHKLSGIKGCLAGPKKVPTHSTGSYCSGCHRQHYSCGIHKQGGRYEVRLTLCPWRLLCWCNLRHIVLKARHIPGRLNVIADKLSRQGQIIQTEWSLHQEVFNLLCQTSHRPPVDMFATRYNCKLTKFVSPVPDPNAWVVDALTVSWENLDMYAFPPVSLLGKVISKLSDHLYKGVILIAPGWPNMPWFWDLVDLSSQIPICLPSHPDLVSQPFNRARHRDLTSLNIPGAEALKEQGFSSPVAVRIEASQRRSTRTVNEAKWSVFVRWCETSQVKQIADFLLHLIQEKNLQPSTIDGYRSAIADNLGNASMNISKDENLNRLLDTFHRDRPKGCRGVPS